MHFKESVWLDLRFKGEDSLLLGCVYRSPSVDNHEGLVNIIRKASELKKGFDRIPADKIFKFSSSVTRGHNFKLQKQSCRLDVRIMSSGCEELLLR